MQPLVDMQSVQRRWRTARRLACLAMIFAGAIPSLHGGQQHSAAPLYAKEGIRPQAVRQGILGSCYFHSVVAALAEANPQSIRKMIQENSDGNYTVEFADGKKETAYPEDIQFSRDSGYDLSDGLWVAVLFRAYAQRVLRGELIAAIDRGDMLALVKPYAESFISTNDLILLAYDRAIRAVVDQDGNIDRARLESNLKNRMAAIDIPDNIKGSLIDQLASQGVFDSLESMIKENGEIFGAYRAVGQGGVPLSVMEALGGSAKSSGVGTVQEVAATLGEAVKEHRPAVACTHKAPASSLNLPSGSEDWYVASHCYTILGYDETTQQIGIRNPWGQKPAPDGVFGVPVGTFVMAYKELVTGGP